MFLRQHLELKVRKCFEFIPDRFQYVLILFYHNLRFFSNMFCDTHINFLICSYMAVAAVALAVGVHMTDMHGMPGIYTDLMLAYRPRRVGLLMFSVFPLPGCEKKSAAEFVEL